MDIRARELSQRYGDDVKFVTKDEAIETSDVIINAMNLTRIKGSPYYNENYFSYDYLSRAKKGLIFINVGVPTASSSIALTRSTLPLISIMALSILVP